VNTSQIDIAENRPGPISAAEDRIASLDVVRGVAVLGIVVANIIGLGQPMTAGVWPDAFLSPAGPAADLLWSAQLVLIDGKFRGLFTLMFGAGLALFYRRAWSRGGGYGLVARRLGWLGVFGFAHWALLWRGDILLSYAVAGFVVMWFASWEWQKQLTLGLIGYSVGALIGFASSVPLALAAGGSLSASSGVSEMQRSLRTLEAADLADGQVEAELLRDGDQAGLIAHALSDHLPSLPKETLFGLFEAAPLMLIGMGLLGAGLFDGRIAARRQRMWGWTLWLAGTLATIPIAAWGMARGITYWDSFAALTGWSSLPRLAAAAGLLALLALWAQSATGWLAKRLAAAGRCALTNYIGTSGLALAVFAGWGLGLFGQLTRLELYGIAVLIWIVMLAWPVWWLARYRYGPLEWLWRCLTYGWRFPVRRWSQA
jgi:uncharacterized protein